MLRYVDLSRALSVKNESWGNKGKQVKDSMSHTSRGQAGDPGATDTGRRGRGPSQPVRGIYASVSETLGFLDGEEIIDTCVPLRAASQEAHSRFHNNPYSSPETANRAFDFLITATDT